MASSVDSNAIESCRLASVIVAASGMPRASTTMCRFDPSLPRSVGLVPVSWPPGAGDASSIEARSQSIWSCSRSRRNIAKCSRCHTPSACQSRRRRQHVMPLPKPNSCSRSSTRLQDIQNAVQCCSIIDRAPSSALGRGSELRNQRFQCHPQFIADFASCHAADDTTFAALRSGCVGDTYFPGRDEFATARKQQGRVSGFLLLTYRPESRPALFQASSCPVDF